MSSIAVLGAGPWGATLALLLHGGGHDVRLWSTDPARLSALRETRRIGPTVAATLPPDVRCVDSAADALRADLVFVALKPSELRQCLRSMAPHLRPEHTLVHVARGLEDGGGTLSRVIEDESCVLKVGALAGPIVVDELLRGEEGAAVVASRHEAVQHEVMDCLSGPRLRVYGTEDLMGVEVGGALRVPWAIALGLLTQHGAGRALWTVLITRALAEGGRLAEAMGGRAETLAGLSGLGDWLATAMDTLDPVVLAGRRLGQGQNLGHPEAERRVRTLAAVARQRRVDMPILEAVTSMLDGRPLREALASLMARPPRGERG